MDEITLSICIVTYRARDYLRGCLESIAGNPPSRPYELIVVDNNSQDGTVEMLQQEFPQVRLIQTPGNQGFSRPMNMALRAARGAYLLPLNPDTLVQPGALDTLVEFLETHPEVGICGPKVLNPDGTLQKPCRRSEARPWDVIAYFSGLARLFPKSRLFGGYLMSYIDEDETHAVQGVSGSCMLIRREVTEQVGFLDERFFAYQEDADYCLQARRAGWQIYYVPAAHVVHFGGQGGSRVEPYRSTIAWHHSYWLYYRKNFARDYFFIFNWVYYALMGLKLGLALAGIFLRQRLARPQRRM